MDDNYLLIKNPDKEFRAELIRQIKRNNGCCPLKPNIRCTCKEYIEKGECVCGLFLKIPCYEVTEV